MQSFSNLVHRIGKKFLSGGSIWLLLLGVSLTLVSLSPSELKNYADFPKIITQDNSDLPGNQILSLYIDSSNVAWIGTNNGLARYDAENWTIYTTENGLAGNQINDLAVDYSGDVQQLLIATNQGLTIADMTNNGIENAISFTNENSDMVGLNTNNVVVDTKHTRWISTDEAVNVMDGDNWLHKSSAIDGDEETFNFAQNIVTDMAYYAYDSLTLISTAGRGIVRMRYNKVDGITGASTFGLPWATLRSNYITSIAVNGVDQWYGGNSGVDYHASKYTKNDWENFSTENHLLDNLITAVAIDHQSNIWVGTTKGLNIIGENGAVLKYTETEGLVNNSIHVITPDAFGKVWVGTSGGMQWFDKNPGIDATTHATIQPLGNKATVYPNPAGETVHVDLNLSTDQQVHVLLYNPHGQLVKELFNGYINASNALLSLSLGNGHGNHKGIFLLQIDTEEYTEIRKLTIE